MLPTPDLPPLAETVYEPAEDSFLFLDCFEELRPSRAFPIVCEIGAGSGVVSTFLKAHVFPDGTFFATDVNPAACQAVAATARLNKADMDPCQMSLTSALRKRTVDVLVFNPPYVPAEDVPLRPAASEDPVWLDLALLGGTDGMVVTQQVLDSLDDILAPGGAAYILFCARNRPDDVARQMKEKGWQVEVVAHRTAGWEVLSILEFKREGL